MERKDGEGMVIKIDFESEEAIYVQLKNQIIKLDRRKGAVIALDVNKLEALEALQRELAVILARSLCKNISRGEVHQMVDDIYDYYTRKCEE